MKEMLGYQVDELAAALKMPLTHCLPPLIQAKIDDFHIFINISAGIYSSVLSYIPFERGIN